MEPIPATLCVHKENSLYGMPSHYKAPHTHIPYAVIFLGGEETHVDTGKHIQKFYIENDLSPGLNQGPWSFGANVIYI